MGVPELPIQIEVDDEQVHMNSRMEGIELLRIHEERGIVLELCTSMMN